MPNESEKTANSLVASGSVERAAFSALAGEGSGGDDSLLGDPAAGTI